MTTVAELSVTFVQLPFSEGAEVHRERLRFFSSTELAESWLRDHLDDPFEYPAFAKDTRVLWFMLLVGETDGRWEPRCLEYDSMGELFEDSATSSDPWSGRIPETCAFAPGDAVLVADDGRLTRGAVKRRPLPPRENQYLERTDDTYLVLFPQVSEEAHEHPYECQMWPAGTSSTE